MKVKESLANAQKNGGVKNTKTTNANNMRFVFHVGDGVEMGMDLYIMHSTVANNNNNSYLHNILPVTVEFQFFFLSAVAAKKDKGIFEYLVEGEAKSIVAKHSKILTDNDGDEEYIKIDDVDVKYDDLQYRCLAYYVCIILIIWAHDVDAMMQMWRRCDVHESVRQRKSFSSTQEHEIFSDFFFCFFVCLMKINYMIKIDAVFRAAFNL